MVLKTLAAVLLIAGSLQLSGCGSGESNTTPITPTGNAALFLEDTSPKNLTATSAAFQEAAVASGWSILGMDNIGEILAERGYSVAPVLVFQACSGKYSSKLLGSDGTRFVASIISCRVARARKSTGEVIISRMNSISMGEKIVGRLAAS